MRLETLVIMARDWGGVHVDMGYVIFSKLIESVDRIWFGAVCKNWHHIAKDYNPQVCATRSTLPMLLVPTSDCKTQRRLYSISTGTIYPLIRLSDIPNKRCCGSSHGWLGFVEENMSVTLINPFKFKGISIQLPVLDTLGVEPYTESVSKLIVMPDSTPEEYTIVALYDGMLHLAFIRSGDQKWTYIEKYLPTRVSFSDIVFHKGLIYATDRRFMVITIDIESNPPRIRILKDPKPFNLYVVWCGTYIVKSTSGDLYAIRRRVEHDFITRVFKVMKLEFNKENNELISWNEVRTLNGEAFFIGEGDIVPTKASNFHGCMPNSVYFVDDYWISDGRNPFNNEFDDSGIYGVEKRSVMRHYMRDSNHRFRPPSIWIQSSFY